MSIVIGVIAIVGIVAGALYLVENHSGEMGKGLRSYNSIGALMVIILVRCGYVAMGSFDQFPTWFALALIGIAIAIPFAVPMGTDEFGFRILAGSEASLLFFAWMAGVLQNGFFSATAGLLIMLLFTYVGEFRQLLARIA